MRKVEFLPAWYPALRRQKRTLWIQLGASLGVMAILVAVMIQKRIEERRQQEIAATYTRQLARYAPLLARFDELQAKQGMLRQRERLAAHTGLQLDPTRLVNVLEEAMPARVQLTELSLQSAESGVSGGAQRRLTARICGLAPSDMEVVTLLTNLGKVKFLDDVAMDFTREHAGAVQATREFALTFVVDLTSPSGVTMADGK